MNNWAVLLHLCPRDPVVLLMFNIFVACCIVLQDVSILCSQRLVHLKNPINLSTFSTFFFSLSSLQFSRSGVLFKWRKEYILKVANGNLCLKIEPVDLLHYCLSTCSEKIIVKLCFVASSLEFGTDECLWGWVFLGHWGRKLLRWKWHKQEKTVFTPVSFFPSSPFFQILFCIFNWTSVKSLSKKPINYPSKFSPCLTVANDLFSLG